MPDVGLTFLWPTFCGNLYPCKSDPNDGLRLTMNVTGAAAGMTAVYPQSIPTDAPSYMPAIAVGDYTKRPVGTTAAGTNVSVWHLPGQEADAATGTLHLVEVFEFFETTYGPYPYGNEVGTVAANWGPGAYGGMEHHPYWHVATDALSSEEVNAHEAAHGWYGNGVRIACWEDFVLSEGTTSYMAARALEQSGVDVWEQYECELAYICEDLVGDAGNTIVLPDSCGAIDILNDPLWSYAPYMKGAYFYREVGEIIGPDVLDAALAGFFLQNVGKAATMASMIDFIKAQTSIEQAGIVETLADQWLRTLECPVDVATLCPAND
jgi:aminopeptidase N